MEFNREHIIKALECCEKNNFSKCTECPMGKAYQFCSQELCTKASALIKELIEENEKLNERLDREAKCQYDLATKIVNLRDDVKYIKAETVRKMQKRLTSDEFYIVADDYDGMQYVDFCAWVEEVAKEVLEENNV